MQPTQDKYFTLDDEVLAVSLELSKGSWKMALHDGKRDKPAIHTISDEQAGNRLTQTGEMNGRFPQAGNTGIASFLRQMRPVNDALLPSSCQHSPRLAYNPHCDRLEWRFSPTTFIRRRYVAGFFCVSGAADKRYSLGLSSI